MLAAHLDDVLLGRRRLGGERRVAVARSGRALLRHVATIALRQRNCRTRRGVAAVEHCVQICRTQTGLQRQLSPAMLAQVESESKGNYEPVPSLCNGNIYEMKLR